MHCSANFCRKVKLAIAGTVLLSSLIQSSVLAKGANTDWGYEPETKPAPPEELKAAPAQTLDHINKPAASNANPFGRHKPSSSASSATNSSSTSNEAVTSAAPVAIKKPVNGSKAVAKKGSTGKAGASSSKSSGSDTDAVADWIELYSLASKQPLSEDQKERFREALKHKLTTNRADEVRHITAYWTRVQDRIAGHEDEKNAFASLFHALLRFENKGKNVDADDNTIVSELLGPERIAVPGDPALTEDSVDAYGDMACFLYEQAHPGKSVDAVDNRAIFASVIAKKFNDAPSAVDKKAMANFALTWAKFKVMYLAASEPDKKALAEQVTSGKPPSGGDIHDALITTIFGDGPWRNAHLPPATAK